MSSASGAGSRKGARPSGFGPRSLAIRARAGAGASVGNSRGVSRWARRPPSPGRFEDDAASDATGGQPFVCGGHCVEWLHGGDARGEAACVNKRRELCQARGVRADPDVVNTRAPQRRRRGSGRDSYKRAAVADAVKRRDAGHRRVKRPVDAARDEATDRRAEVLGAGDEGVCTGSRTSDCRRGGDATVPSHATPPVRRSRR